MPSEQSCPGPTRTPRRVFEHGDGFGDGELAAAKRHHADARGNVVVEHDDGVVLEMPQHPVPHGADAGDLVGDGFDLKPCVGVFLSLAYGDEQGRRRKQLVAGDRVAPAAGQNHQSERERAEFRPCWRGGRVRGVVFHG